MQNDHPGDVVRTSAKRPRKPGRLTKAQKALSAACGRVRVAAECAIGRCKYKCLQIRCGALPERPGARWSWSPGW